MRQLTFRLSVLAKVRLNSSARWLQSNSCEDSEKLSISYMEEKRRLRGPGNGPGVEPRGWWWQACPWQSTRALPPSPCPEPVLAEIHQTSRGWRTRGPNVTSRAATIPTGNGGAGRSYRQLSPAAVSVRMAGTERCDSYDLRKKEESCTS